MADDRLDRYLALLNAEVNMIRDTEVKDLTKFILKTIPKRTWTMRTSKNHHPEDERGYCGNIIHTLRVIKLSNLLLLEVDPEPWQRDVTISQASLHDCKKFGPDCEMNWMHPEHAKLAADEIRGASFLFPEMSKSSKDMVEIIATSVENHMSKWQKPPVYVPKIGSPLDLSFILVLADFISAQDWITVDLGVD